MKKLYIAALCYLIAGLGAGVFYREFTKLNDFHGDTQLSVAHTHLLALGMLVFLIALALDRVFDLSGEDLFNSFFWLYNAGLIIAVGMMFTHGIMQVYGVPDSAAISGIAGLGHIILSLGLVLFFVVLGRRVGDLAEERSAAAEDTPAQP